MPEHSELAAEEFVDGLHLRAELVNRGGAVPAAGESGGCLERATAHRICVPGNKYRNAKVLLLLYKTTSIVEESRILRVPSRLVDTCPPEGPLGFMARYRVSLVLVLLLHIHRPLLPWGPVPGAIGAASMCPLNGAEALIESVSPRCGNMNSPVLFHMANWSYPVEL